ncbi:MAG: adenylate/guanylate cyclase domain-containing protein [Candidatus Delongbacteria bacterium]|jgi:adenylate cyclase|nr:adenylate/guanylate cyclase domain-containing protein [Candidatus Delongbacteria bacterium]
MDKTKIKILALSILISMLSLITVTSFFDRFENQFTDLKFKGRYYGKVRESSIKDIVVVDVDSRSVSKLGKYFEWPRAFFAETVKNLAKKKSKVVGFDLLFNQSRFAEDDSIFCENISNAGNVVAGYNFQAEDRYSFIYADTVNAEINSIVNFENNGFFAESEDILDYGSRNIISSANSSGNVGITSDDDGVIRRISLFREYRGKLYPSFALVMCMNYLGIEKKDVVFNDKESLILKNAQIDSIKQDIVIPLDSENRMLIHYRGTWKTYRTVSFYDIYKNRLGRKTFKNNIVLLGTSLRGLMDLRSTPLQYLPGVEVHANIINTIIKSDFISEIDQIYIILIMLLLSLIVNLLVTSRLHMFFSTMFVIISSIVYYKLSFYLFNNENILIDITRPIYAIIFSFLTTYTISYYNENKSKKFIKSTLGRYVPEVVSKEMLKNPDLLKVGGMKKEITMMFSDIRGFTSYSEKTDPKSLVEFLNHYLKEMTKVVKLNQGTLDKYMGDAVICFFGAPLDCDHPHLACKSALNMLENLEKMRPHIKNEIFRDIEIGLGINTDVVTVGNIGSDELFDYTAIGDGMNLASRLEGLNKYYGTKILTSGTTYEYVKDDFIFREVDLVSVKGKVKPVRIYELIDFKDKKVISDEVWEKLDIYNKGLKLYREGEFDKAKVVFSEVAEKYKDKTSELLIERCEFMIQNPPDDWKGVWKMEGK